MNDEESPQQPSKSFDRILSDILLAAGIPQEEIAGAPPLEPHTAKEQLETYEGTSDQASLVEQLADKEEERDEALDEIKRLNLAIKKLKYEERFDLHGLRKEYIPKLFVMICLWLVFVAGLVFFSGYSADNINNPDCQINCTRFSLDNNVLIAVVTTATATVVGLFVVVANWLFPKPVGKEK